MSMKRTADEAIQFINSRMASHSGDSRTVSDDEVTMCAMACRIDELEEILFKAKNELESWNLQQGDKDTIAIIKECCELLT